MTLTIKGSLYEDLFGIPWLKKTIPVDHTVSFGSIAKGENLSVLSGHVTIGITPVEAADGSLEADIKVAVMGLVILNQPEKLVPGGVQTLNVGSGQLKFTGSYEITE